MQGPISDDAARRMYAGGHAGLAARRLARLWGLVFAAGIGPQRWVRLEVPGRRSGRVLRIPIGLADVDGRWYAVSMLGECNWVRNVRANDGRVVLRHLRAAACVLHEVSPAQRPPVLRRYLEVAPGGRPHIPATATATADELAAIADRYPIFAITHVGAGDEPYRPPRSWLVPLAAAAWLLTSCRRRIGHRPVDR